MKEYLDINNIKNIKKTIKKTIQLKKNPRKYYKLGKRKTIGLLFFNNSLRTLFSTQKAAFNLGLNVIRIQCTHQAWTLEFEDGSIMNGSNSEHIKEAAQVISQYCDIIGIRCFASLTDKEKDLSEYILYSFKKYGTVPIVNMESATAHPLQALADAVTIAENTPKAKPKIVLSWAPHPKALPHAVANSFIKMMQKIEAEFVITHPKGYELDINITKDTPILYNQQEAFKEADFIYTKNWSNFNHYGKVLKTDDSWLITQEKMNLTNNAKFMHCLPVRRNVVVEDSVLDSENSLVIEQANNRTYATQIILQKILKSL